MNRKSEEPSPALHRSLLAGLLIVALTANCAAPRATARASGVPPTSPRPVSRSVPFVPLADGRFRILLERPSRASRSLTVEEARSALGAFHASLPLARRVSLLQRASYPASHAETPWQEELWHDYASRYGTDWLPSPSQLEEQRFRLALQLSPKYMPEGFRAAAQELLTDPLFVTGVMASLVFYLVAWTAPEPLFTKGTAFAMTVALLLVFTVEEIKNAAVVLWSLYQETQQARTLAELEAAAERFGKAAGATVLRIMVMVAGRQLGKLLPEIPPGGGGGLLRLSPSGPTVSSAAITSMQVAADGSLLMTLGAGLGTTAQSARQEGLCSDRKGDGYEEHHIATIRNSKSSVRGGPWTPLFEDLFASVGLSMEDKANIVYLRGHYGPHPLNYHQEVYDRLRRVLRQCRDTASCRKRFVAELKSLGEEICSPGSMLNGLLTKFTSP